MASGRALRGMMEACLRPDKRKSWYGCQERWLQQSRWSCRCAPERAILAALRAIVAPRPQPRAALGSCRTCCLRCWMRPVYPFLISPAEQGTRLVELSSLTGTNTNRPAAQASLLPDANPPRVAGMGTGQRFPRLPILPDGSQCHEARVPESRGSKGDAGCVDSRG